MKQVIGKLVKKTYSLPESLLQRFESVIPKNKRSQVMTKLLLEWMENQEQEKLRKQIIEGCQEMQEIYLDIEREYHPLEEEVERQASENSKR
jgi:metal-responsive CopG/Arc/MetJ family transcriptional regulator